MLPDKLKWLDPRICEFAEQLINRKYSWKTHKKCVKYNWTCGNFSGKPVINVAKFTSPDKMVIFSLAQNELLAQDEVLGFSFISSYHLVNGKNGTYYNIVRSYAYDEIIKIVTKVGIDSIIPHTSVILVSNVSKCLDETSKPYEFIPMKDMIIKYEKYNRHDGIIKSIDRIKPAIIKKDGRVEEGVYNPDYKPWFWLSCSGINGATFDIITDLVGWYPVRRYGVKRIVKDMKPKVSLDLSFMSVDDLAFIKRVIIKHFEQ